MVGRDRKKRSLRTIDGIGPAFEDRLQDVEITTATQLAAKEPAALASRIGLNESRVTSWVDQAGRRSGEDNGADRRTDLVVPADRQEVVG